MPCPTGLSVYCIRCSASRLHQSRIISGEKYLRLLATSVARCCGDRRRELCSNTIHFEGAAVQSLSRYDSCWDALLYEREQSTRVRYGCNSQTIAHRHVHRSTFCSCSLLWLDHGWSVRRRVLIFVEIPYSLGSPWVTVSSGSATYSFTDDSSSKTLVSKTETPAAAPLGTTNVLVGL